MGEPLTNYCFIREQKAIFKYWQVTLTVKVVGHQWYWSYEYSDFISEEGEAIDFDSYMIPESDLELGQFRLLDVDSRLVIPVDCHIRLIVTGKPFCPYYH